MINRIKHLRKRKGFTLVECIVAVAVFAALVMVVFMILANARTETNMASDAEKDLNNLIDNVVGDDTYKIYNASNSDTLSMSFNGYDKDGKVLSNDSGIIKGDFAITYNTISGYKNFVSCPACATFENNTAFMGTHTLASFGSTSLEYTCPNCSEVFEQVLVCDGCLSESENTDTDKFTYDTGTGSYYCDSCGSSSVQGKGIKQLATDSEGLSISGMTPNAIRYGKVPEPSAEKAQGYVEIYDKDSGNKIIGAKVKLVMEYTAPSNHSVPGRYKFILKDWGQKFGNVDEEHVMIVITMPNAYLIENITIGMNGAEKMCNVSTIQANKEEISGSLSQIVIDDIPNELTQVEFSFNFVNYKNYYSFDRDYTAENGLADYWFKANSVSTKKENGSTTYAYATIDYTMTENETE